MKFYSVCQYGRCDGMYIYVEKLESTKTQFELEVMTPAELEAYGRECWEAARKGEYNNVHDFDYAHFDWEEYKKSREK